MRDPLVKLIIKRRPALKLDFNCNKDFGTRNLSCQDQEQFTGKSQHVLAIFEYSPDVAPFKFSLFLSKVHCSNTIGCK